MASPKAIELAAKIRILAGQRIVNRKRGVIHDWVPKYTNMELAEFIDQFASEFHAARLSDAGYQLIDAGSKPAT